MHPFYCFLFSDSDGIIGKFRYEYRSNHYINNDVISFKKVALEKNIYICPDLSQQEYDKRGFENCFYGDTRLCR